jgi:hypothetical protein
MTHRHPWQAISRLEVRFFWPGNRKSKLHTTHAAPGHALSQEGIDRILEDFIDQIDKGFPTEDFELVQIAPGKYNCVHRGARKAPDQEIESFSRPETSAEIKQRIMERLDREEQPSA